MGSNPLATFGIAFLFGALPQQLYASFFQAAVQASLIASTGTFGSVLATVLASIGAIVISLACSMLVQGALVRTTMAYAEGQQASIGQSIATGVSMILPLLALTVLMVLGLVVGFTLLIVPGIILAIMWSVAVPALVAERTGVFAAFARSRFLTKGQRWKIFGLLLLLAVISWIISGIVGVIMVTSGGMTALAAQMASGQVPIGYIIFSLVLTTLISAIWGTVQTSLYISLRNWKEGPQTEALAEVFA
jgi:hypothetical protein